MPTNERRPVRKPAFQQNLFVPTQAMEPPSATAEQLRGLLEENYRQSGGGQVLLQPPPGTQGNLVGEGGGIFDPAPAAGPAQGSSLFPELDFDTMMRQGQQNSMNAPLPTRPPTQRWAGPGAGRSSVLPAQRRPEPSYAPPAQTTNLPQVFTPEVPNPYPPTRSEEQTLQMFQDIQRRLENLPTLGPARELPTPPASTPDPAAAIREESARERARQTQNLADKEVLASAGDNPARRSRMDRIMRVLGAWGDGTGARDILDMQRNDEQAYRERILRLRTAPFGAQDRAEEARAGTASEAHRAETQTRERAWETIARNVLGQNDRDVQSAEVGARNTGVQVEGLTSLAELRARLLQQAEQRRQEAAAALAGSADPGTARAGISALLPEGLGGTARAALGREAESGQLMEGLRAHILGTDLSNQKSRNQLNRLLREFNPNLPANSRWLEGLTPDEVYNRAAIGSGAEGAARNHPELRGRGRYLFQPPPQ